MKGKYKEEDVKVAEKVSEPAQEKEVSAPSQEKEEKTSETPKYYNISIDSKIKEIIDLDSEGYLLSFESDPQRFKKLPDEVVNELSRMNRDRYRTSFECYKGEVDQKDNPENFKTPGLDITSRYASATARLEVEGKRPGVRYCWASGDDVRKRSRMGYKVCNDPNIKTFHGDPDGVHRVADERGTELVLMEAPQSVWKEHRKHVREKSARRRGAVEATGERDVKQTGYKSFRPSKGPQRGGPNFSAPVDEKGKPLNGPS